MFRLVVRSFFYLAALVFLLGGTLAILEPKVIFVGHAGHSRGTTERVSEKQALVYGLIAYCFGMGALYAGISWNKWQAQVETEERTHHHSTNSS